MRSESTAQRRRMVFGVDTSNMEEPLWWGLLEETDDYRMWRMEKAIERDQIAWDGGRPVDLNSPGEIMSWLTKHFAWQAFGWREGAYVQSIGLLMSPTKMNAFTLSFGLTLSGDAEFQKE